MDLRQLTPNLAVSPQIDLEDVALLAGSGILGAAGQIGAGNGAAGALEGKPAGG